MYPRTVPYRNIRYSMLRKPNQRHLADVEDLPKAANVAKAGGCQSHGHANDVWHEQPEQFCSRDGKAAVSFQPIAVLHPLLTVPPSAAAQALSPALLARAQSLAVEHAKLSKLTSAAYDVRKSKRLGELSDVTAALKRWEGADSVSGLYYLPPECAEHPILSLLGLNRPCENCTHSYKIDTPIRSCEPWHQTMSPRPRQSCPRPLRR